MTDNKEIYELQQQLQSLKGRARTAGYKNNIPRLPISNTKNETSFEARLVGFNKRLRNWKHDLMKFENVPQIQNSPVYVAENGMIIHTSTDKK